MVSANLAAAVLTILPAMGLLWFYLGRYEGYFAQNRLFFALVVGLFAGIAVRFVEVQLFPFDNPFSIQGTPPPYTTGTLVYSFAYTSIGFAMLETLGKTAVLGFKNFRMRRDTAYYGIALGLGFGAMWVTQVLSHPVLGIQVHDGHLRIDQAALIYDAFVFLLGMGVLLAQGASAIWVGRGAGEGRLWQGAMHGTLWLAPALACYWYWLNSPQLGRSDQVLPALGALAWGIFAMTFADRRVLLKIVPPEIREMIRKEKRRESRKQSRE